MQDRYVGDAGDYAKYSLLMALAGTTNDLRVGVVWYLFPNEIHNEDGCHVTYLERTDIASRAPSTHAALAALVASGKRSVAAIEQGSILPVGTTFFNAPVLIDGPPTERAAYRNAWFQAALRAMAASDLVFLDPDNGIETPALDKRSKKAGKYVFWSEIETAWAMGKSLVIYSHLNRSAPASVQTERLRQLIEARVPDAGAIMPILFRRGSCRHMWILAQPRHQQRLEDRVLSFLSCGWSKDSEVQVFRPKQDVKRRTRTNV
jgi:hypothetical protein